MKNSIKYISVMFVATLAMMLGSGQPSAYADNILANPGFEDPIGSGVGNNWDSTNGAVLLANAGLNGFGFGNAPEGFQAIDIQAGEFTFQQVNVTLNPGDLVAFSGVAQSTAAAGGGSRLKIEFRTLNPDGSTTLIDQSSVSDLANAATAPQGAANPYVRFSVHAVAPARTTIAVLTIETAGGGGRSVWDKMEASYNPAALSVSPTKSVAKPGEPILINAQFRNSTNVAIENMELIVDFPDGFSANQDSVFVNNQKATVRQGSLIITVGTIPGNTVTNVAFVLTASSAVSVGSTYEVFLTASRVNGGAISTSTIRIQIEGDPVFQESILIGKVFNDLNQNGYQDRGEKGVPGIRLITEEGIIVVTGRDGKYHIPNLVAGRHIIKIDGHTLPEGTKFITEESFIFRATEGVMSKVNFAVLLPPSNIPEEYQDDLDLVVTQGLDLSRPNLEVKMSPSTVKLGVGQFVENPIFEFKTNYPDFIKRWYLEIRDVMGREVWTGFGLLAPPAEVMWEGNTEEAIMIKPGIYSYRFKVEDAKGRQDWTPLHFFRVLPQSASLENEKQQIEIPSVGDFNIFHDGKRSISLVAKPTVRIAGTTQKGNEIMINNYPVDVNSKGEFQKEFYTEPGDKEYTITTTTADGESTSVKRNISINDSMFFMVGLAEEELGVSMATGNVDSVGKEDRFKDGFYADGRLSYYLLGKIKGKFLIKSHYDTSEKRSELFTNLDPEEYYPIYGDSSTRDYEAHGTQDKFYFVIEMDRSFIKYGSFETSFTDTELATYNRTLSGLKIHHETLSSTPYGDPKRGFKLFWSEARQRADHNEFAATGGTLYYLRNRNVIEGSEKLRVETRDKVQDISISSYDLQEGKDYEIDYDEGRILLTRPLSSVSASDTLVTDDLLDGNQVYLVVDYEFDAGIDIVENSSRGVRGFMHMGDHLKVGATAIEEKRLEGDYDLRAVDATLKVGRNTKITAEYAESKLEQVDQAISYNGGLTFADLGLLRGNETRRQREYAYLVKAESKPIEKLEVSGYVQGVQPSFSTDRIRSQEGTKKVGVQSVYRFNDHSFFRYRFDQSDAMDALLPFADNNVFGPFESVQTHIIQAAYDDGKWLAQAEYIRRNIEIPAENVIPSLLSETPFENGLAAKFGFHFNERLLAYVKGQTTSSGGANHQLGGGVRYEVAKDLFAYVEQMFGTLGDSTYLGFEKHHPEGGRSYANIRMADRGIGTRTLITAIGSSFPLTKKSRIYSEREHSTYASEESYADIFGIEGDIDSKWKYNIKYERRHLDNSAVRLLDVTAAEGLSRNNTYNTVSGGISYSDGDRMKASTLLEFRRDQDVVKMWQIVTRNQFEYKINRDLSFKSILNYGISQFRDPSDRAADFMEFNTGFAYRPVDHDRLNLLTRYTYVRNIANDEQFEQGFFTGAAEVDESAHILSLDVAYDINRFITIVEKFAYKHTLLETSVTDNAVLNSFLWANRVNIHVTKKWDIALEYRLLKQSDAADNFKHGALVEVDREFYDYVRVGVGYDFTDFSDDLRRSNGFTSHGPFVRLTGKF